MVDRLKETLSAKGYTAKVIPADGATAEMVKKYLALPRNFRGVVSVIEGADLGSLQAVYKENGIERLLLLAEGNAKILAPKPSS